MVEVDVQQAQRRLESGLGLALEELLEAGAIEQAGERIALRERRQAILLAALRGDVRHDAHEAIHALPAQEQRDATELQPGRPLGARVVERERDALACECAQHPRRAPRHFLRAKHLDGRVADDAVARRPQ